MASYIWDLDGTLLDSYPVITAAVMHAAADVGIRDTEEYVLRTMKQGTTFSYMSEVAERSGAPFQTVRDKYRTYTHEMDGEITLMDGAEETLERLRKAGATHDVFTHSPAWRWASSDWPLSWFRYLTRAHQGWY